MIEIENLNLCEKEFFWAFLSCQVSFRVRLFEKVFCDKKYKSMPKECGTTMYWYTDVSHLETLENKQSFRYQCNYLTKVREHKDNVKYLVDEIRVKSCKWCGKSYHDSGIRRRHVTIYKTIGWYQFNYPISQKKS